MDRENEISEEEKIAREGLRNKHELVQNGNVMVMKHKGKHLKVNNRFGELIINDDKDFPCTFESYARLLVLSFSESVKEFSREYPDSFHGIQFKTSTNLFKKLEELAKRDVKDKQKLKYYVNIITQIFGIINNCEQKLLIQSPNRNFQMTSEEIIDFFNQIISRCLEIDNDIKDSYKAKK